MAEANKTIRVGGAAGFWGEASLATKQLLDGGDLDYLVYDYLAEITMAILSRMEAKDPTQGFATDFVSAAMAPKLAEIAEQKVKVISNAGGVNPKACAEALRATIADQGLNLKVATVEGDDILPLLAGMDVSSFKEMFTGADFPELSKVASANAYLGAFPIAEALKQGADIVVTGRCVDSAVTLAACIDAFGWKTKDFDHDNRPQHLSLTFQPGLLVPFQNFLNVQVRGWLSRQTFIFPKMTRQHLQLALKLLSGLKVRLKTFLF